MVRWSWVNFQCRGVLLVWIRVGQGPTALAVGAGGGCLDIFTRIYPFSSLSPSLWETTRYRLKYCLKGSLSPKTTNQKSIFFNMKACCVFSIESPHRGAQHVIIDIISTLNYLTYFNVCSCGIFPCGLKNEFEKAVINEPSVFEPLKFFCIQPLLRKGSFLPVHCSTGLSQNNHCVHS